MQRSVSRNIEILEEFCKFVCDTVIETQWGSQVNVVDYNKGLVARNHGDTISIFRKEKGKALSRIDLYFKDLSKIRIMAVYERKVLDSHKHEKNNCLYKRCRPEFLNAEVLNAITTECIMQFFPTRRAIDLLSPNENKKTAAISNNIR
ncbi:MAG: hypothetical protein FWE47_03770 [Oscillospiraceae bacterium]|nr:hypothetical protein [Oscillospiraceae bacterium]